MYCSDTTFEYLEAGYLEQCAMNMKTSLAGVECPTQVILFTDLNTEILNLTIPTGCC